MVPFCQPIEEQPSWRMFGVVTAAGFFLFLVYYHLFGYGFPNPDTFDYAQIAREIVRGNGFSTKQIIHFQNLIFLKQKGLLESSWPSVFRFPLPSLIIALFFIIFGCSEFSAMSAGGACYALTGGMLFLIATKVLRSKSRALAAAFGYLLTDRILDYAVSNSYSDSTIFPFSFTFLLLVCFWLMAREKPRPGTFIFLGIAGGMCCLNRGNFIFALPVVAVAVVGDRRFRVPRPILLCFAGFTLTVSPWWVRNWVIAGHPLFNMYNYFFAPFGIHATWDLWDLSLAWNRELVGPLAFIRQDPGLFLKHCLSAFSRNLHFLPGLFGIPALSAGFLFRLILWKRARTSNPRFGLLLALGGLQLILSAIQDFFERHYLFLAPLVILFGFQGVWLALDSGRLRASIKTGIVIVLIFLNWTPFRLFAPGNRPVSPTVMRFIHRAENADMKYLRRRLSPGTVVMSDASWLVAWGGDLRSIRLFLPPDSVDEVQSDYLPVGAVYFSPRLLLIARPGFYQSYLGWIRNGKYQERFYLDQKFDDGALLLVRKGPRPGPNRVPEPPDVVRGNANSR